MKRLLYPMSACLLVVFGILPVATISQASKPSINANTNTLTQETFQPYNDLTASEESSSNQQYAVNEPTAVDDEIISLASGNHNYKIAGEATNACMKQRRNNPSCECCCEFTQDCETVVDYAFAGKKCPRDAKQAEFQLEECRIWCTLKGTKLCKKERGKK